MPGKKEQIALQKEVTNQEQWEDLMTTEGVIVVDVYQKWCGPCNAVVSLFRRMRNETGDDLLKLAVAEADSIDALEKYRGKCEPCFLFFAGGQLVHVIRGAQGPSLAKGIVDQLAMEHRVLDEGAERQVIVDPLLAEEAAKERAKSRAEEEDKKKTEEEAMSQEIEALGVDLDLRKVSQNTLDNLTADFTTSEPIPKEVTVLLVKPDAVQASHTDEIVTKLNEHGFEILTQTRRTLTEEEAREFYKEQEGEEHFEDLIKFMSSGDSDIFVVTKGDTGEGVVGEIRTLLGPKDVNVAKEEVPESWRAVYGTDTTMNALHAADSAERAARELTFFFPEFVVPIVPGTGPPPKIEKTLALIRPDALKEHKDAILEKIHAAGFEVCLQKEVQLTEEQAKAFYTEHEGEPFYDDLVAEMTRGPTLALGLAKEEAIQGWRDLLGPKEVQKAKEESPESLRAQFSMTDASINGLHGSDSVQSATKELEFFFPKEHTLAVIKPDAAAEHKEAITERLHEAGFQISSEKHIELSREMASQLYQEHEGKEFYESLLDHMTSGPSTVLLLHREDAIHGLRALMGPADPEVAREQAPESFRALLGKNILENAIHGSSSVEHVAKKVGHFFPEVEVTEEGKIIVTTEEPAEAEPEEQAESKEGDGSDSGEDVFPSGGMDTNGGTENVEQVEGNSGKLEGENTRSRNDEEENDEEGQEDADYNDEEFEDLEEEKQDDDQDGGHASDESQSSTDEKASKEDDKTSKEGDDKTSKEEDDKTSKEGDDSLGETETEVRGKEDESSETVDSGEDDGKGGGEDTEKPEEMPSKSEETQETTEETQGTENPAEEKDGEKSEEKTEEPAAADGENAGGGDDDAGGDGEGKQEDEVKTEEAAKDGEENGEQKEGTSEEETKTEGAAGEENAVATDEAPAGEKQEETPAETEEKPEDAAPAEGAEVVSGEGAPAATAEAAPADAPSGDVPPGDATPGDAPPGDAPPDGEEEKKEEGTPAEQQAE